MTTLKSLVLFNIAALLFCDVDSGSPDYCLAHLNMSDCGRNPTPVFHYYKPGSICKLAMWKGCETENMFNSAQQCTKRCIKNKAEKKVPVAEEEYRCDIPLDTHVCTLQPDRVYTYCNEKQSCVEAEWYGCPSPNKFKDKETCEDTCYDTEIDWKNKLKRLDMHSIKRVQNIVDELLKTNDINNDISMESETFLVDQLMYLRERNLTLEKLLRRNKPKKSFVRNVVKLPKKMEKKAIVGKPIRSVVNASKKYKKVNVSKQYEKGDASKQYEKVDASKQYKKVDASKQYEKRHASKQYEKVDANKQYEKVDVSKKYKKVDVSKNYEKLDASKKYEKVDASKQYEKVDASKKYEKVDASKQYEKVDASKKYEKVDASKQYEKVDASKKYEKVDASKQYEKVDASKQYEKLDASKQYEKADSNKLFEKLEASKEYEKVNANKEHEK